MKIELLAKLKKIITNEWVKRFLLGASLIFFAGLVFYIVSPKWHYLHTNTSGLSGRYNSITGEVWDIENDDEGLGRMMKVRLKKVKRF